MILLATFVLSINEAASQTDTLTTEIKGKQLAILVTPSLEDLKFFRVEPNPGRVRAQIFMTFHNGQLAMDSVRTKPNCQPLINELISYDFKVASHGEIDSTEKIPIVLPVTYAPYEK